MRKIKLHLSIAKDLGSVQSQANSVVPTFYFKTKCL